MIGDLELELFSEISTHALREEGDRLEDTAFAISALFLPTPSARRATERW